MTSALFRHIEAVQDGAAWGAFLDAGTGVNSALWSTVLPTDRWLGVSASKAHAAQVAAAVGPRLRDQDAIVVGDWADPELRDGERFDTVLADYLLGAVEGFAPYFQPQLFARLRPLVGRRLYVVGLDPYVVGDAPTPAARIVRAIGRWRDVCLLLADETPYREYPAEWAVNHLAASGFRVIEARRFPNRYRDTWINSQLNMGLRRLPKLADRALASALADHAEALRAEALAHCETEGGLRCGYDYVISCAV